MVQHPPGPALGDWALQCAFQIQMAKGSTEIERGPPSSLLLVAQSHSDFEHGGFGNMGEWNLDIGFGTFITDMISTGTSETFLSSIYLGTQMHGHPVGVSQKQQVGKGSKIYQKGARGLRYGGREETQ